MDSGESQPAKCSSCGAPKAEPGKCRRCGWDDARVSRRCAACDGMIVAKAAYARLKVPTFVAAPIAVGLGAFGGALGAAAALLVAGAVGHVVLRGTVRQRCRDCGAVAPDGVLTEAERRHVVDERFGLLVRAIAMGALGVALGGVWLAFAIAASSEGGGGGPSEGEGGPGP